MNSPDFHEVRGLSKREYFERKGFSWDLVQKILRHNSSYKSIMNAGNDEHHLVARSRGGGNHETNRIIMGKKEHGIHHDYFGVLTPGEQVGRIVELNRKVFMPDVPRNIMDILDSANDKNKMYKPEVFK